MSSVGECRARWSDLKVGVQRESFDITSRLLFLGYFRPIMRLIFVYDLVAHLQIN
jgi:hypothetical protein